MTSDTNENRVIQLTPPGRGAVATLRIEGPGAIAAVQSQFRPRGGRLLIEYPLDRLVVGHFGGPQGEEVVVRRCGNGAVELHCHGGRAAVAAIEAALVAAGCRPIGWLDWAATQSAGPIAAAALAALADARTQRTAAILLDQFHGALGDALDEIRHAIDLGHRDAARQQIGVLLARAAVGLHLVKPWRVVLAGRVNVGKSSLINALAGYQRSIVHAAPGTTRDAVTLSTAIDGWPVELCDTAGLRSAGSDAVEQAGIALAVERLAVADLAILVFDRSVEWSADDDALLQQWPVAIVVHNKCDLPAAGGPRPPGVFTSALQAGGIVELLAGISARLVPDPPPAGAAVPFTAEQVQMVRNTPV